MPKMYRPLTKSEQQDRATRLAQKICPSCPHDFKCGTDPKTGKATHGCEECIYYLIMNSMIGEVEF